MSWMRRLCSGLRAPERPGNVSRLKKMAPSVGDNSPLIARVIVDLPLPDSPTSASVSPCRMEKEIALAAAVSLGCRNGTRSPLCCP